MRIAVPLAVAAALLVIAPHLATSSEGEPTRLVRLVVGFDGGIPQDLPDLLRRAEAHQAHRDPILGFVAVTTTNPDAAATLASHPRARYVVHDGLARIQEVPDDPRFPDQWGLPAVRAPLGWGTTRGAGVLVAVVDTGVDLSHPDLLANLYFGRQGEAGYDFVSDDADPADDHGHGTRVAGVVAAVADNGVGVAGVAPEATILAVKVLNGLGEGPLSVIASGVRYAADEGADVITLSLGATEDNPALRDAIQYAHAKGAVLVAATGNYAMTPGVLYPAAYPEVIAVGALGEDGRVADYSNGGPEVDLVAPGDHVLSTARDGKYGYRDGTSMAAPHVAGAAALLLAAEPGLAPTAVQQRLQGTARDVGAAGYDPRSGWGIVNASIGPVPDPLPYASASGPLLLPTLLSPVTAVSERFLVEADRANVTVALTFSDLVASTQAEVRVVDEASGETAARFVLTGSGGTGHARLAPGLYRAVATSMDAIAFDYALTVTGSSG